MPKLPNPQIRPWSQHTCTRSTTAQVSTPALASTAVTSATGTTLVNSGATWTTNQYQNFWVTILTGTGAGQTRNITSNTATTLTVPTWGTNPDNTSTFQIVQPLYPGLQGSLAPGAPGGSVLINVTYREVVPTAGAAEVTARLKTTTAAGTLTLTPIRLLAVNPDDPSITDGLGNVDTTKVQKYSTGGSSATTVVAGTELALTVNPAGEAYCLLEFACTTAGTLNYCDVMTLQAPGNITTSGGGGGSSAVTTVDGGDVTQGSIADAGVTGDTAGTVNAHLRGTTTVLGNLADAAVGDATGSINAHTRKIAQLLAGGGGGGPVPVIVQDPTLTYTQPTGDAFGARAIHASVNGEVAAGASAASLSPILIGLPDASGNAQYWPMALLNNAPNITTQNAPIVKSVIAANGAANVVNLIGSGQNLGDNGNGSNYLAVVEGQWNGTSFDRRYGNLPITTLASSARTTTQTSADLVNYNGRFIHVILNVTSAGTGSITLTINGKDPASATYYPLLVGAAITTNSQNVYRIGVGLTAAANSVANDFVPRLFQFVVTANNANLMTYSLGYNLLN